MSKSYTRVKAVMTAADILDFLADQAEPVTGGEIARALDMPTATVMSQLSTLADRRYVDSVGQGFELGEGLAMLWAKKLRLINRKLDALCAQKQELETTHE